MSFKSFPKISVEVKYLIEFTVLTLQAQEKKVKLEEKRMRLASAAALLEGRNADGCVFLCS